MGLSSLEILDIVELIYFIPALVASVFVVLKHGGNRLLGWRFLVLICLFRVVGAILSIVSIHHPSSGIITAADVMNNFGLSAIICTALGLLGRTEESLEGRGIPNRIFRLLGLPVLAGLILSIIGSTNVFSDSASDQSTGFTELKAGVMLFLAVFVVQVLITGHCLSQQSLIRAGERRVLFAVTAALPFIGVRVLYSILCVFDNSKYFSSWSSARLAVLVHGVMGILMEAIIVTIFIIAGFLASAVEKSAPRREQVSAPRYMSEGQRV